MTSTIGPVYIFTGSFTDLLFTPYGPGGLDTSDGRPSTRYWGDENTRSMFPCAQDDAAAWTIDILLRGEGVQTGEGSYFKVRSGVTTIEELAAVYHRVYATEVDVVREGSIEDLEARLARLRKEKGNARYLEYMHEEAASVASKGLWENRDVTVLPEFQKPATLEKCLIEIKDKT